eukprot:6201778-Pleurochrysis_carterae.AAC.3
MYHPTEKSIACEESTLRARERCMSHGEDNLRRRSLRASHLLCRRLGSERGGGVENAMGGGAAGARRRRCGVPALMQECELRKGSVRRCGVERSRSHWPSAVGADPTASSGVPPAMALDCKPVRANDTGVGMSVGVTS